MHRKLTTNLLYNEIPTNTHTHALLGMKLKCVEQQMLQNHKTMANFFPHILNPVTANNIRLWMHFYIVLIN